MRTLGIGKTIVYSILPLLLLAAVLEFPMLAAMAFASGVPLNTMPWGPALGMPVPLDG